MADAAVWAGLVAFVAWDDMDVGVRPGLAGGFAIVEPDVEGGGLKDEASV